MAKKVQVNGKNITLDPNKIVGAGGEAEVFDIGNGQVLKLFKGVDHPDVISDPTEVFKAKQRLDEHQTKLPSFPHNLPQTLIAPIDLAKDGGKIVGYTMPFIANASTLSKWGNRGFRQAIDPNAVPRMFEVEHDTLKALHKNGVIIGDYNELNVMVTNDNFIPYHLDADSMQFGNFLCKLYTQQYVDPHHCDPKQKDAVLFRPYNEDSDWFAYHALLCQSLLFILPFQGKYTAEKLNYYQRSAKGISILHGGVTLPPNATKPDMLPDEVLHQFDRVFEKQQRGEFPRKVLDDIRWTKCSVCGAEHARVNCPSCGKTSPAAIVQKISIHGTVKCTLTMETDDQIVYTTLQGDRLLWLAHRNNGDFVREDKRVIFNSPLIPGQTYRLQGQNTIFATGNVMRIFTQTGQDAIMVDDFRGTASVDSNSEAIFYMQSGNVIKKKLLGFNPPETICQTIQNQTKIWVGQEFGLGWYRAGELNSAYVFFIDAKAKYQVNNFPRFKGQIIDSHAYLSNKLIWLFVQIRNAGVDEMHIVLMTPAGEVIADHVETDPDSGLMNIGSKYAIVDMLFGATDDGIVRYGSDRRKIITAREYPDTKPFVSADSNIFVAPDSSIYVIGMSPTSGKNSVRLLAMS